MKTNDFSDFVNGVSARVNEIIDQTQDLTPSFLASGLFDTVDTPDDLVYRTQGVTGLSYLEAKDENGRLKQDRTYPAYQTEYVMQEKGKVVSVSQLLMKTRPAKLEEKLNEVRQLMLSTQRSLKKHAWQILVDGFSTSDSSANFPIMRLADAVSLYSTAHPSKVPGVANRSNRGASDPLLSETSLFTLQNLIREQLNGRGMEVGYDEDYLLVVPPALTKLATEVCKSEKKSDSANNDLNFYSGVTDMLSVNYLGNASNGVAAADTSWYVFAKTPGEGNRCLKYVSLIAPKIEQQVDFFTKAVNISVDAAWAMGYSNFELTSGSDGTAN